MFNRLLGEQNMQVNREQFLQELKLRKIIRKGISVVLERKETQKNQGLLEEQKLRNVIRDILTEGKYRFPLSQLHATKGSTPDGAVYSDAKLIHLSNRNIPKVEVSFVDCYPKSLSALDYNQGATDTEYLQATVTFGYKYHSFTTPF